MRVIHPSQFETIKKPKKRFKVKNLLIVGAVVLILLGLWQIISLAQNARDNNVSENSKNQPQNSAANQPSASKTLRVFQAEQFKHLAFSTKYPNTVMLERPPSITGVEAADEIIQELAESRGYKLSNVPVSSITKIDEPRLDSDDLLQPLAARSWSKLKSAAEKDNVPLALLSAYRSINYQRTLFVGRLTARGATISSIANRRSDNHILDTLKITAPPGYSRHHNGYTIDLWCEDGLGSLSEALVISG